VAFVVVVAVAVSVVIVVPLLFFGPCWPLLLLYLNNKLLRLQVLFGQESERGKITFSWPKNQHRNWTDSRAYRHTNRRTTTI